MITVLVVLGITLLAVPIVCTIFVIFSKMKQKKRSEIVKNVTTTKTTVKKGPNGRTVFETTTTKPVSAAPPPPPRTPILPFTQQQASKAAQPKTIKSTWQRLSRPFSMAPAAFADDQVELNPMPKQRPDSRPNKPKQHTSPTPTGLVSPISPPGRHRVGSSSSWNTVDALESSPISPLSVTGGPSSSSKTGSAFGDHPGRQHIRSQQVAGTAGAYAGRGKVELSSPPPKARVSRK